MAQVVEHYQLANTLRSRKGGDELAGLCPFHGSARRRDDPFRISLSKNNFNCFQCKRGGNILDLVAEVEWIFLSDHLEVDVYIRADGHVALQLQSYIDRTTLLRTKYPRRDSSLHSKPWVTSLIGVVPVSTLGPVEGAALGFCAYGSVYLLRS